MKSLVASLFLLTIGLLLITVCGEEEVEAPLLDSLSGYWKYSDIGSHGGCGSEEKHAVYWFKDDGTYKYLHWNDSYGLIKIDKFNEGTWSLGGDMLTTSWEESGEQETQTFAVEFTSESVILELQGIPTYTREYIMMEHPWMPVDYRSTFSLPAEDPS